MSELAMIFYKTIKHNSCCVICKAASPQFHHVYRDQKIAEIHKVAKMGDLVATIEEFNKCIPLCQVHHTAVHKGVIPGYLRGTYDNGRPANDDFAKPFMPYINWFANRKKHVILDFYRDQVERNHGALAPIFSAANLQIPKSARLSLVSPAYGTQQRDVPDNKPAA